MHRLSRFVRLPAAERRLLIEAMLLLGAIALGLVLLPFQTVRHLLDRVARTSARSRGVDYPSAERVAWAVTAASRYVPKAGSGICLIQALATQTMLARRGHPAVLRIGLTKDEQRRLLAHAWVESRGEVVIGGSGLERYTILPALEGEKP